MQTLKGGGQRIYMLRCPISHMKIIYLCQYNNYYNRTLKVSNNLKDYTGENNQNLCGVITNASLWNPNDGVDTVITSPVDLVMIPDYCVIVENDIMIQRWFVIEARRISKTQYRLSLHRDLLADNKDEILNNKFTYVERGFCADVNDAIYNTEPITFNQVKTSQMPLYDRSGIPWIVGYLKASEEFPLTDINFVYRTRFGDKINASIKWPTKDNMPYPNQNNGTIMFCMPFDDCEITEDDESGIMVSGNLSQQAAYAISEALSGAGWLIDLQLLPYCPNVSRIIDYKRYKINNTGIHDIVAGIYNNTSAKLIGYVLFFDDASFFGDCYTIQYDDSGNADTVIADTTVNDIKIESQTTKARIVSPNGNGAWDFTPAKILYAPGKIKYTYYVTCMPYQPYIKIMHTFGRLYGNYYKDVRGLICGGDFSLPQVNDAWNTYQLQNKNYQVMFNRQIESLDLQNKWTHVSDIAGAISGTISGASQGMSAGLMAGSVPGAIIGGSLGGAASGIAGAIDVSANKQIRDDQRDLTITQHNLQLQNIQALPDTISKLTNFNGEQLKVPYVEIYTCTVDEKSNFELYLRRRGYTINRYGPFIDYIASDDILRFYQGQIIRIGSVIDDAHFLEAINYETSRGFYATGDIR